MNRTLAGIIGLISLVLLVTLLPFLPGQYDPLAIPLSMMARVFGFTGLLLVPVGAFALVIERRGTEAARPRTFAVVSLVVAAIVWTMVALAAWALGSFALAVITAGAGWFVVRGLTRASALFLIVVPIVVFVSQRAVLEPAVEFSRDRAIRESAPLIASIEQFRVARGHYPVSLLSVQRDYSPGIIGIDRYRYEPHGEAYNVAFEQPAVPLGTQEIVVYNPRDEQTAIAHLMDILEFTPEHLARTHGHYAVHAAKQPHWKYFWFD